MLGYSTGHLLVYSGLGDFIHPRISLRMFVSGTETHMFLIIIL